MSDQNSKSGPVIVAVVVALALAAGAYFFLNAKKAETPAGEPVATIEATQTPDAATPAPEGPIVSGEVPPQPETPQNVVVETKQLEIPGATAETPAPAVETPAVASSPDVEKMMGQRSIGSKDAPIKLTEYSSLTCSHCAHFHKDEFAEFKTKFIDTGKVELTFKEFPLNAPAVDASMILRCMPEEKFVSFMSLLFDTQDNWAYQPTYKDILRQNAKLAGMSDKDFDSCLANTELKERLVSDMKAASDKYKIQSTPSFIVNDGEKTIVGAQPLEFFEKTFSELKGAAPAAAPAAPAEPAAQ